MWRMSNTTAKWTFLTFCFYVPSLWPPFIHFSLSHFHLESTLLGWKTFCLFFSVSRGMRLWETDLQSLLNHTLDFPNFADQNHIRSSYFFLPRFTLESISFSPDFQGYLKNLVSQIRCAARRDNMCLLSPSKGIKWRASLGSFHQNELLRKVVIEYRVPSFPAISIQLNLFLPQTFWLFSNPPPASYISSRKSFVQ